MCLSDELYRPTGFISLGVAVMQECYRTYIFKTPLRERRPASQIRPNLPDEGRHDGLRLLHLFLEAIVHGLRESFKIIFIIYDFASVQEESLERPRLHSHVGDRRDIPMVRTQSAAPHICAFVCTVRNAVTFCRYQAMPLVSSFASIEHRGSFNGVTKPSRRLFEPMASPQDVLTSLS